jgi:hypothetical protein
MRYSKAFCLFVSALMLAIWAGQSLAIEPIPRKDGFSGVIGAGANYFNFKSNEIAKVAGVEVSEKNVSSTGEPESKSSALPSLNFDLRYTLGSSQTQFFLANELFDLVKLDSYTELGVRQQFADRSILSVGVVFSGMVKVYSDPYVLDTDRGDTKRTATGVRVVYDKIMGSGLALEAMYRKIDIDEERSGTQGGFGLTPSQIALLDRNAKETSVGAQYTIMVGEGQAIIPGFTFINYDADGDAITHKRYQFDATYAYRSKEFDVALNLLFAFTGDYDQSNPLFDKKQNDTVYGGFIKGVYKNLADVQGLDLVGKAGAESMDADIDFLNSQAVIAGASVQYRF